MQLKDETNIKAEILTRGVVFSSEAIQKSLDDNAKGQNMVYNAPLNGETNRPQELFLTHEDGYTTVVSCVSPHGQISPVTVAINAKGNLTCMIEKETISDVVTINFVSQPNYYHNILPNGEYSKKYISACGYDELNIIPWKGCSISKTCKFCGVNNIANQNEVEGLEAGSLSVHEAQWDEQKDSYLKSLYQSIEVALDDSCYKEHMHVILISGNLSDEMLDKQADIYSDIVKHIKPLIENKSTEGVIAVISPPKTFSKIDSLKDAGVEIVVYNLEVGNEPYFTRYCPGKSILGREFFIDRLKYSVDIFGRGKVWTNFVLGLEPIDELLNICSNLADYGIVSSANVLHLDEGNRLDCGIPTKDVVVEFFYKLSLIYKEHAFNSFYCSKALRTSLSNEMSDGRFYSKKKTHIHNSK